MECSFEPVPQLLTVACTVPRNCPVRWKGLMDRDYASYDDVPYHSRWRHFEAGGLDRTARLKTAWDGSKNCDDLGSAIFVF